MGEKQPASTADMCTATHWFLVGDQSPSFGQVTIKLGASRQATTAKFTRLALLADTSIAVGEIVRTMRVLWVDLGGIIAIVSLVLPTCLLDRLLLFSHLAATHATMRMTTDAPETAAKRDQ